jgi:hypothetical protein
MGLARLVKRLIRMRRPGVRIPDVQFFARVDKSDFFAEDYRGDGRPFPKSSRYECVVNSRKM